MNDVATTAGNGWRLFWPALLSLLGVAILCTLGAWQIVRMNEKRIFIERLSAQAAGAPAIRQKSSPIGPRGRRPPPRAGGVYHADRVSSPLRGGVAGNRP